MFLPQLELSKWCLTSTMIESAQFWHLSCFYNFRAVKMNFFTTIIRSKRCIFYCYNFDTCHSFFLITLLRTKIENTVFRISELSSVFWQLQMSNLIIIFVVDIFYDNYFEKKILFTGLGIVKIVSNYQVDIISLSLQFWYLFIILELLRGFFFWQLSQLQQNYRFLWQFLFYKTVRENYFHKILVELSKWMFWQLLQ